MGAAKTLKRQLPTLEGRKRVPAFALPLSSPPRECHVSVTDWDYMILSYLIWFSHISNSEDTHRFGNKCLLTCRKDGHDVCVTVYDSCFGSSV